MNKAIQFRSTIPVLSTIVVTLSVLLVCENAFQVNCENKLDIQKLSLTQENQSGLILPESDIITFFDPNNRKQSIDIVSSGPTGVESSNPIFSCKTRTLYWTLKAKEIFALKLSPPQSKNTILTDKASAVKSIALDFITEKLYIGNDEYHTIEVVDLQTGYRGIIRSEKLPAIRTIAIDPIEGYLFVLGDTELIRMDLDGVNIDYILRAPPQHENNPLPRESLDVQSIALDTNEKRVYWTNDLEGTIYSSTYDGSDRKLFFKFKKELIKAKKPQHTSLPERPFTSLFPLMFLQMMQNLEQKEAELNPPEIPLQSPMAYLSDNLYWADNRRGVILRINVRNSKDFEVIHRGARTNRSSISSFDCHSTDHHQAPNPCAKDNGGCQHLCVLSRSLKSNYRCFCKIGYELAEDGSSCRLPTKFIAFTQDSHLRGINWRQDTEQFIDVLDPSKRGPGEDGALLEVDTQDGTMYYLTKAGFHGKLHGDTKDSKHFILSKSFPNKDSSSIAFDWASQNLYYVSETHWQMALIVLNTKNPTYNKILTGITHMKNHLAIHPNRGYVYITETRPTKWYPPTTNVTRINTDGSGRTLVLVGIPQISCIAIDYNQDRIYWNEMQSFSDAVINSIGYSNLDGTGIMKVVDAPLHMPFAMAIQGDWIYTINNNKRSLDRVPKGGGKPEILITSNVYGLSIFDPSIQTPRSDHPCANGNHTCEKFCFAVPVTENAQILKRVCGCPYGEKLALDGRSCVDNSVEEPPMRFYNYESLQDYQTPKPIGYHLMPMIRGR